MSYFAVGVLTSRTTGRNPISRCFVGDDAPVQQTMEPRRGSFALAFAGVALLAAASLPAFAQAGPAVTTGRPTDWSHHHAIFSNPGTFDDAMRNGTIGKWNKIVNEPRYQIQQLRRNLWHQPGTEWGHESGPLLKTDWSMNLGSGATVGAGQYPAKYSFNGNASCQRLGRVQHWAGWLIRRAGEHCCVRQPVRHHLLRIQSFSVLGLLQRYGQSDYFVCPLPGWEQDRLYREPCVGCCDIANHRVEVGPGHSRGGCHSAGGVQQCAGWCRGQQGVEQLHGWRILHDQRSVPEWRSGHHVLVVLRLLRHIRRYDFCGRQQWKSPSIHRSVQWDSSRSHHKLASFGVGAPMH